MQRPNLTRKKSSASKTLFAIFFLLLLSVGLLAYYNLETFNNDKPQEERDYTFVASSEKYDVEDIAYPKTVKGITWDDIVWYADLETGDITQWTTQNGSFVTQGTTGSWNVGTSPAAHSGNYSVGLTIDPIGAGSQQAAYLFKWLPDGVDAKYYSAWFYIPSNTVPGDWWNIFQFKSPSYDGNDNPVVMTLNVSSANELFVFSQSTANGGLQSETVLTGNNTGNNMVVPRDQWFHIEAFVQRSTSPTQVLIWQDGVNVIDIDLVTARDTNYRLYWGVNNYAEDISPSPNTLYVDDAVISEQRLGPSFSLASLNAVCGNGTVESGEVCDDSNTNNGDQCSSDCQNSCTAPQYWDGSSCVNPAVCGNGSKESGEACDDGNTNNGDQCSSDCQNSCTSPMYWNGSSCVSSVMCGNGTTEDGEICDDGNTNDGDQCSSDCQNYCPIGQIWKDGACASTAQSSSDNSSSSSQQDVPAKKVVINEIPETDPTELCGNGVLDEGEECDDGNNEDLDGCSNNCFKEEIEFQNEDGSLFFPSTSAIEQSEETASDGSVTILVLIIACFVSYLAGLLFFLFKRRQSNVEKEAERVTKKI